MTDHGETVVESKNNAETQRIPDSHKDMDEVAEYGDQAALMKLVDLDNGHDEARPRRSPGPRGGTFDSHEEAYREEDDIDADHGVKFKLVTLLAQSRLIVRPTLDRRPDLPYLIGRNVTEEGIENEKQVLRKQMEKAMRMRALAFKRRASRNNPKK